MKRFICTVCPKGCRIEAFIENETIIVRGTFCKRGEEYAKNELKESVRTLTATCLIALPNINLPLTFPRRVPVKTLQPLPVDQLIKLNEHLRKMIIPLPVTSGQIILSDWHNTGVVVVATRSINLSDQIEDKL